MMEGLVQFHWVSGPRSAFSLATGFAGLFTLC
jgi:hypothetical protein